MNDNQFYEIRRSSSCPSLNAKLSSNDVRRQNNLEYCDDMNVQMMKLIKEGCESAENIGLKNLRRFSLKNIYSLVSKTSDQIRKNEVTAARSRDPDWIMKNYILAFMKISNGWKNLDLLQNQHEEYVDIEKKFYCPEIRNTFNEWQSVTIELLDDMSEVLKLMQESIEKKSMPDKKCKVNTNLENHNTSLSKEKHIGNSHNINVDQFELNFPSVLTPIEKIKMIPYYCLLNRYIKEDDNNKIQENNDNILTEEETDNIWNINIKSHSSPNNEWKKALLSASKLIEANSHSIENQCEDFKTSKQFNIRNYIKKEGTILMDRLEKQLFMIANKRIEEIIIYRACWKNALTLSDIQNKLINDKYFNDKDFIIDIERMFYSMLDYFKHYPDEFLKEHIIDIRDNFWTVMKNKLSVIN